MSLVNKGFTKQVLRYSRTSFRSAHSRARARGTQPLLRLHSAQIKTSKFLFGSLVCRNKNNQGFVAVISAIIITSVVFMVALVFSTGSFLGRFDSQNLELKDLSVNIAEGCLEYARLKLAEGTYTGNETKIIGGYNCYIAPIEVLSSEYVIRATSSILNKETKLKLTIKQSDLETITFEEY